MSLRELPSDGCAFCGREGVKMTREHALPQWLSRLGAEFGRYTRDVGGKVVTKDIIDVVTKRVCEQCNSTWLSQIETAAQAVLEPLIQGTPRILDASDRQAIATWFCKTILTTYLGTSSRRDSFPIADSAYKGFYRFRQPFAGGVMFLSGYSGPVMPVRLDMQQGNHIDELRCFFHFHRVLIYGITLHPGHTRLVFPEEFGEYAMILWPTDLRIAGAGDPALPGPVATAPARR